MNVARLYSPGDLRIEEAEFPEPGSGDVTIRVRACATCGTDAKIFHHGHHHISLPRVLGHEIAGEVEKVGPEVDGWARGDRVQVIAAIPCGACHYCRRRQETVCENLESMGYQYDGAFAEFMRVPQRVLHRDGLNRVPHNVPFEAAALTEPLACVLNGQEIAEVGEDDDVVILGAGPIGCLHVRLARARGARSVTLIDVNQRRLDMAARSEPDTVINGADEDAVDAVRKLTEGRGADVVITATGAGQAQEQALEMAARRARISLFGGLPRDNSIIRFDSNLVHYRELFVLGAYGSAPRHNQEALELISSGAVPVEDLITHRMPLDGVEEAISIVTAGDGLKVVIQPG
jgi:L-iditol 2-dehydrogenase